MPAPAIPISSPKISIGSPIMFSTPPIVRPIMAKNALPSFRIYGYLGIFIGFIIYLITQIVAIITVFIVSLFNDKLRENNILVETGIFGADMKVSLVNDGPTTIIIDSIERNKSRNE